jgi:hypothetical protein
VVALLSLLLGGIAAVYQNPSGSWRLNRDLSEDVAYEETGFAAPPELLLPLEQIVLSLTDTSVTFYDEGSTKRRYPLSEERQKSSFRGFQVQARARWNGKTLRIALTPGQGLFVVEEYFVDRNPNHLILSVSVLRAGRRAGPGIRYVYDSVFPR